MPTAFFQQKLVKNMQFQAFKNRDFSIKNRIFASYFSILISVWKLPFTAH